MNHTPMTSFHLSFLGLAIIGLGIALAWLKNDFNFEPALAVLTGVHGVLSAWTLWGSAHRPPSNGDAARPPVLPIPGTHASTNQLTTAQMTGERLRTLISRLNETTPDGNGVSISRLAMMMALDRAGDLERYVAGQDEPTFDFLRRLAASVGSNPEWLITGKGPIFPCPVAAMYDPMDCAPIIASEPFERIYFVRSRGFRGETVIMARESEFRYRLLNHPWTISGEVGAGGQWTIRRFLELLNSLSDSERARKCGGRMISAELFDRLVSGDAHPDTVFLAEPTENPWWDDFCDIRHRMPIANQYEFWYGAPFLAAQQIAGSR